MEKKKFEDPFDGEYIGNIWGWRFSFIGLGLILFFLALMVYRHWTLGVDFRGDPIHKEQILEDSLKTNHDG